MEGRKVALLHRIESDREVLLDFLRRFIRCPSPNPPGDTRQAADHIRQFLERHGAECRVIAPIHEKVRTMMLVKYGSTICPSRRTRNRPYRRSTRSTSFAASRMRDRLPLAA
jgi:acetylornithine deacetylase/succinyl-diaminopimelate desuccinylase-like protein